jgi:hypothetical protein
LLRFPWAPQEDDEITFCNRVIARLEEKESKEDILDLARRYGAWPLYQGAVKPMIGSDDK